MTATTPACDTQTVEEVAARATRFWDRVERTEGCWIWCGPVHRSGYGRCYFAQGWTRYAHRVAYLLAVGPVAADLELDHLCRNRRCVNPDHLELVSHRQNILRGLAPSAVNARRTSCVAGHPFDARNTYVYRDGTRQCRRCRARRQREYKATLRMSGKVSRS